MAQKLPHLKRLGQLGFSGNAITFIKYYRSIETIVLRCKYVDIARKPTPSCLPSPSPLYEPISIALAPLSLKLVYLAMWFILLVVCTPSRMEQRNNKNIPLKANSANHGDRDVEFGSFDGGENVKYEILWKYPPNKFAAQHILLERHHLTPYNRRLREDAGITFIRGAAWQVHLVQHPVLSPGLSTQAKTEFVLEKDALVTWEQTSKKRSVPLSSLLDSG